MNQTLTTALSILQPLIEIIISIVGPVIVVWLSTRLANLLRVQDEQKKLEIETTLRDALHKAAENALKFAMTKYGMTGIVPTSNMSQSITQLALEATRDNMAANKFNAIIETAVQEYLIPKMPETIDRLKATELDLANIVSSKVATV